MTHTTNFKRALCCLLVLVVLIVTPTRVYALGVQDAINAFAVGEWVVSSIFKGLGVSPGEASDDFNMAVSECWDFVCDVLSFDAEDLLEVLKVTALDTCVYMVNSDLVNTVRAWMYDSGVCSVSESTQLVAPDAGTYKYFWSDYPIGRLTFTCEEESTYFVITYIKGGAKYYSGPTYNASTYNTTTLTYSYSGYYYSVSYGNISNFNSDTYGCPFYGDVASSDIRSYSSYGPSWCQAAKYAISNFPLFDSVTTYDLILQSLVDPSVSIATGYADWAANSVTVEATTEDEEVAVYYPIALGNSYEETVAMTQEQVWAGTSTYTGTVADTETATGTETLTASVSEVLAGVNSIVDVFTGTCTVATPLEAIQFGALFDLFPFNIPYGLYQSLAFWASDSVAPVIPIALPTVEDDGVGVYTYEVNLSDIPGFDGVVALIRAGELILFAIGLLMITRKVTKW